MMASPTAKAHDPMYNFDTHFPERLSRLHLHGDFNASGSFRKKKNRAQRSGARYKTQPVTFDEIKEVDEEPVSSTAAEQPPEQLKGQLQAFSRSMDGLLPRGVAAEQPQLHISHSRSGSRKFQRHPDCIPERAEAEQPTPTQLEAPESRLQSVTSSTASPSPSPTTLSPVGDASPDASISPVPSPNIAPRRQKVTAKAKKRQKAFEDADI
ncbi:uncharacterized protein LOC131948282 [Physella acuta]|uniref:uncharacterized protein LOC131948282 n=1 Tax=Physella acuta TaxID=109671 RepID=UPI0027DD2173|nr:uncharacterized protein LOC131948282 [Physella acuta]XP_059165807.1 uncharacterized protein LOC131948282 [Physella acuta]XP_059165808.1 uncharacterized protein LOC131948282 [Physella acuta]XP_059165809.1 uncharacterized protein LOC131948282 [Physella acuta]